MRRIVAAVRSFIDRLPALLKFAPDALLLIGYVGLALTIAQLNTVAAWAWVFGWPFAIGLLIEARSYGRRAK